MWRKERVSHVDIQRKSMAKKGRACTKALGQEPPLGGPGTGRPGALEGVLDVKSGRK